MLVVACLEVQSADFHRVFMGVALSRMSLVNNGSVHSLRLRRIDV